MTRLEVLPGGVLVAEGLLDLAHSRVTVAGLAVSMAATRLRDLGLAVPPAIPDPELRLWAVLSQEYGDAAHSRFNALSSELVSFQRALACAA